MKILVISDQRLPEMESQDYLRKNYHDVDFVISCGDMEPSYLEYISTILNVPLFYVRGNHDDRYEPGEPGGQDLHNRFTTYKGITMIGLEGSMYYNGKNVQYRELQMLMMVISILPRLLLRRILKGYGVDFLITHAPPHGIHDRSDITHRGFRSFRWLMRLAKPRYLLHGHIDIWDRREITETQFAGTKVININPKRIIEAAQGE